MNIKEKLLNLSKPFYKTKPNNSNPKPMKQLLSALILFLTFSSIYAQSNSEVIRLISCEKVNSYTVEQLKKRWKDAGIPEIIAPVKYDVDIYEVIYNTCWHDSSCVKASGLYFVPKTTREVPLVVYHHGTQIEKFRGVEIGGELGICMGFATDGYAVAYSDYIGLGKGDKFHLYHHVQTEANASMDLVRAVRIFNETNNIKLNNLLFTTGYSQGGHATMAFQKVVEADPILNKEFKITASSPMSGAYDLTGVQEKNMFEPYSHPGYLPYLMVSFQEVYGLYDNLADAFVEPYDSILPPMFNGQYSMGDINNKMPSIPKDVIKPEIIEAYIKNENFPFKVALKQNSTHNWVPKTPMMLCYCEKDEQVNYRNSLEAHKSMKKLGAKNVRLKRVAKGLDHNQCALFAVLHTKLYFDSFIKGSKKGNQGPLTKRLLISFGKNKLEKDLRKKEKARRKNQKKSKTT